jgi:hypothetical protein
MKMVSSFYTVTIILCIQIILCTSNAVKNKNVGGAEKLQSGKTQRPGPGKFVCTFTVITFFIIYLLMKYCEIMMKVNAYYQL